MPVTKSSIGPINGAFTTNSALLQPAWVAPRKPTSSATATTGVFQTSLKRKGMIFMSEPFPVLSPRDGLTIFVNCFHADHAPFKMSDVGSVRQRCVKAIDVFNFDHYQRGSRDEKHSDNQSH